MLEIKNLHAKVEDKSILNGINLNIKPGEIHAIMGKNGSGKSTLSNIITGKEGYEVTQGDIKYKNESITEWTPEKRSLHGIFMSFQYPVVMPGVNNTYFLKAALNAKRKYNGQKELDAAGFLKIIKEKLQDLKMDSSYLQRAVNDGFSGGEKKRNEILQMALLEPKIAILDETDSGLDIDALRIVASGIKKISNAQTGIILITHYQRLLDEIEPNYVHVMSDGQIIKTGESDLALELEEKGYEWTDNFIKKT